MRSCSIILTAGEESRRVVWRSSDCQINQGDIFIEPYVPVLAETLRENLDQATSVQIQAVETNSF
jgi:hypothetical protein